MKKLAVVAFVCLAFCLLQGQELCAPPKVVKATGTAEIEYQSSELRKYRDQARDEATKAAKEKAVTLAQSLGNQVGKTYSIEEVQQWNGTYGYGGLAANAVMGAPEKSRGPSTAPGQLTVSASVIVSFDLL